jgi:pimeloyl-ACP methyl ester carboxylesterase
MRIGTSGRELDMKRFFKWFSIVLAVLLIGGFALGYTPDTDPATMKAKYAAGTSQFMDLEKGLRVHYRDEGKRDGQAIVLIHGSNASLHTWEPWVKRLGSDYRIISLDLPGHGLTGTHPSGNYDYPVFVDVVDKVMLKLGIQRAVIGGNSMGGGVTWMYALSHPEKVDGLILVDAAGAPQWKAKSVPIGFRLARMPVVNNLMLYVSPRSIFEKSLKASISVKSLADTAMVDRYWELNRYPGNRAATLRRFSLAHNSHPATPEKLAAIKAPVMIMWGEEDSLIPVSSAKWFADALPGAKTIIYPKVGHIPMEEVPDRSAADVKAWVDALPKTDAQPVKSS